MAGMIKGMLRSEKELADTKYERLKKALSYIKKISEILMAIFIFWLIIC